MYVQNTNNLKERLHFIDNLRLVMIIIVVMVHTSVTYSGIGGWYYIENKSVDTVSTIIFGMFNTFSQAYFMGFLFLLAGYFVPGAYDKKGPSKFIKDRLFRLGLPVFIYIFIISPFIEYFIMGVFIDKPVPMFWSYYSNYISHFGVIGHSGPLWFALALLIFSIIYAVLRMCVGKSFKIKEKKTVPGNISILLLILLIATLTFVVRLYEPVGTDILNMQLCFFTQYILLFIVGIFAYRRSWFNSLSYKFGVTWLKLGALAALILWAVIMVLGGPLDGKQYVVYGGFYWQSAAYAFWEQLFCAAMCLGLIVIFRDKFNRQGKLMRFLTDNAFGVYVFHPVVLISVSMLLRNYYMYPLVKFVLAVAIVLPIVFIISSLIRKIPGLKKVFS